MASKPSRLAQEIALTIEQMIDERVRRAEAPERMRSGFEEEESELRKDLAALIDRLISSRGK